MKKILPIVLLVFLVISARSQSCKNDSGLLSVNERSSQKSYEIEKFVLQFWYLIKVKDLKSAEKFVQNPEHLEAIFEKLKEPIDYQWRIIRSINNKSQKLIIDMFVSYPRYLGDPQRKLILQIRGTINENGNAFESIQSFFEERIDTKKFIEDGIYPNLLALPQLYLIKNRTARTVLDSVATSGMTNEFFTLSNRILEKLENNERINPEDLVNLIENHVSSEVAFFHVKLFGDHYNKYVLSGKKMFDNSIEESNYFLREGILISIDDKLSMNDDFVPFSYTSEDSCRAILGKTKDKEIFPETRNQLALANTDHAIQLLLKSSLPQEIKKELEIFCGAEFWLETRYEDVKKGRESYVKLFALTSIMTRRMLEIMSQYEKK